MSGNDRAFGPSASRRIRFLSVGLGVLVPAMIGVFALAATDHARGPLWIAVGGALGLGLVLLRRKLSQPVLVLTATELRFRRGRGWAAVESARIARVEEARQTADGRRAHLALAYDGTGAILAEVDLDEVDDAAEALRALRALARR
jgi:hypothetical protein